MLGKLRGAFCASVPLSTVCGVAVLGCRWPGQPRLLRDPPCAKEYEGRVGSPPVGSTLLALGSSGEGSACVCVVVVMGFVE